VTDLVWLNPIIAFVVGIILAFNLRKIFARVQSRRGPLLWMPGRWQDINHSKLLQPLYDIIKLFSKQTIIPHTATTLFILGPILALICALMVTLFVPIAGNAIDYSFSIVVIFYLLIFVTLFIIMGGISSASLFSAIGSVREVELMLANEIPFILGIFALVIAHGTLSIQGIMGFNLLTNPFAAIAVFIAILVKLHVKPFDIPEAESEIVGGMTTEYSGKLLGILEIVKLVMLFTLSAFYVDVFLWIPFTGLMAWVVFIIGILLVGGAVAMVNALFARFRIDQATTWLFRVSMLISIFAVGWSFVGAYIL
jgi:NADH-quinone oxidoreductase subunit H